MERIAKIGETKVIAGKHYEIKAIANNKPSAEQDARILRRRNYAVRIKVEKMPDWYIKAVKVKTRYLICAKKKA